MRIHGDADREGPKQNIAITVFAQERYEGEWPPENANEFLAWFSNKIASIPSEYRATASIRIDSVKSWGDTHEALIKISYERPKTNSEPSHRLRAID